MPQHRSNHRRVDTLDSKSRLNRRIGALPFVGAMALVLAGCGARNRTSLDNAQFDARAARETAEMSAIMEAAVDKIMDRADRQTGHDRPTLNLLAISGGGDWGAFGSGFLVGWGKCANPADRRPDFDAVTGVSTGALLAPFVYLGTDEAVLQVDDFYRDPRPTWIESRGMLFFMPWNPSFVTIPGLRRDIERTATKEFVEAMAAQSRDGKVLIISATDIDLGRQRFWEVGTLAQQAAAQGDPTLVTNTMFASSAIPAVFPPVEIGDGLFVDGGVTANVFLRLNMRNPRALLRRWQTERPGVPFPRVRYWVIINNQLAHAPRTVQERWPDVMSPALTIATRSGTIAQLQLLAAETDFANATFGTDIEMRVAAIPDSWRPPVEGPFQKQTMQSLSDLGRTMGADPNSWQLWAAPGGAGAPPPVAR